MTSPVSFTLRLPLSGAQRGRIQRIRVEPAGAPGTTAGDALVISGVWPGEGPPLPPVTEPLRLRPIFPGFMRFIAHTGQVLPAPDDLTLIHDEIDPNVLKRFADIEGTLVVSVEALGDLKLLRGTSKIPAIGKIPGIEVEPTLAYYGPVKIGLDFLKTALLDPDHGLEPRAIDLGAIHKPGTPRWKQLAVAGFLGGTYRPVLRSRGLLADDDAETVPMPSLVIDQGAFSLHIALGWPLAAHAVPLAPVEPDFESIPARAFLQHVAPLLREQVLAAQGADAVVQALMLETASAKPWRDALAKRLIALGFGSLNQTTDIQSSLREFQIAAGKAKVARRRPLPIGPELPERDFRSLEQADNPDLHAGPVSGRANRRTRALIERWEASGLRSPIVIPALTILPLPDSNDPAGPPEPDFVDIWERYEVKDVRPRFFVADFSRSGLVRGHIDLTDLETLGYYAPTKGGGPSALTPNRSRYDQQIELLPDLCLGKSEAALIAALDGGDITDPDYALASTFRVIRAISECENEGFMAVVTAYDGAGVSFGPCHWCIAGGQSKPGESTALGGVAAYFAWIEQEQRLADPFRPLGLCAFEGEDVRSHRKTPMSRKELAGKLDDTRAHAATLGFLDDRGVAREMRGDDVKYYMASWRTLYHWVHLARTDPDFSATCWKMAVRRLEAMLLTQMDLPAAKELSGPTIGDVFTSEILVAQLLRWHIKAPDGVVKKYTDNDGVHGEKGKVYYRASDYVRSAHHRALTQTGSATMDEKLQDALLQEIEDFKRDFPEHKELPGQFRDIAHPTWIKPVPDGSDMPVIDDAKNLFGYRLDPRLRVLKGKSVRPRVPYGP